MDKSKIPFLNEDTIRIQRVEIYLHDLKQRLRQIRLKHEAVVKDSVELFEELDEVSTSLLPGKGQKERPVKEKSQNIRNLIQEFDKTDKLPSNSTAKANNNPKATAEAAENMRGILQNIERLNTSNLLQESVDLFQNAKDFFEKVDNLVGKVSSKMENNGKPHQYSSGQKSIPCPSLKDKILMFDNMSKHMQSSSYKLESCSNSNKKINSETKCNDSSHSMEEINEEACEEDDTKDSGSSDHSDEKIQSYTNYDTVPKVNSNQECPMTDHDITELSELDERLLIHTGPSCSTSFNSIETFHTCNEFLANTDGTESHPLCSNEIGYEGDCDDSELNLYANKKRKAKH